MKLLLKKNEQETYLSVSDETLQKLLNLLIDNILEKYKSLNPGLKTMAQMCMREVLKTYERKAYENGASKEEAQNFRPAKGQDSVEKGIELLVYGMQQIVNNATVALSYNNDDIITDITAEFQNKSTTR